MVKRSNQPIPPTHNIDIPGAVPEQSPTRVTGLPKVEQPTPVSGYAAGAPSRGPSSSIIKSGSTVAPPSPGFKLPETVSAAQERAASSRYGMPRAAPRPPEVEQPTPVASRPSNQGAPRGFTLPDTVSAAQVKADSFRYGNISTPSRGRR
jgi:hypothetical protein